MAVRPPAVADLFYPGDPGRLRAEVAALLASALASAKPSAEPGSADGGAAPKALIAPHAGYIYSGRVAAAAFAALRDHARAIRRVVLIGPAHYVWVRGIAAPTAEAFETPLGAVPVDLEALRAVADLPVVRHDDAPHRREHALEVELPFLQSLLGSFAVVPLLVGDAAPRDVGTVLERLWGEAETLVVVSSDLSHYLDYDTARGLDSATAAAIERGEWTGLRSDNACGFLPIAGLLVEAGRRGLSARRLALCNSGDTAGTRDRVVGYGAWMMTAAKPMLSS